MSPFKRTLASFLKPLASEYRAHAMARMTFWVFIYGAALKFTDRFGGGTPGPLWLIYWIALAAAGLYYLGRLVGYAQRHWLWSLRSRLIVTYIFIGVLPLLLVVALFLFKDLITGGQFAAYLVSLRLRARVDELQQLTRVVVHEAHLRRDARPEALLARLQEFYSTELVKHAASYPELEITLRLGETPRAFQIDGRPLSKTVPVPSWLAGREEFSGLVLDEGELTLRSLGRSTTSVGDLTVILSEPVSSDLLDQVGEGVGPVELFATPPAEADAPGKPSSLLPSRTNVRSRKVELEPARNFLDRKVVGAIGLEPFAWEGDKEKRVAETFYIGVASRMFTLSRQVQAAVGGTSVFYVYVFLVLVFIFLALETFSAATGYRLAKTITKTVDRLYSATERVKTGDFSYRIGFAARDQLSALGESFDGMTASVERLLREAEEKSRLESELEIARQVQRRLFPPGPPEIPGLTLYGACKPARTVSGDYYDFLPLGEGRLGLVLGDVSGKGISAALLMATIQSAVRSQSLLGDGASSTSGAQLSTAEVVSRLNRQLFESTSVEKYSTIFFAIYEFSSRRLTYTNAGHLPPLVFKRDGIAKLEAGGTVVGLFSKPEYEQAQVRLEPGDLFFAFTDGLTEPENIFGEELGEKRLVEVVRRGLSLPPEQLVDEIYRHIADWTGSPELQDDMTMIVGKSAD